MRLSELDYELPAERIATRPAEPRDAARLLVCRRETGEVEHRRVRDLPGLGVVGAGDVMVVNQTRVLPAAFEGVRQATGGRVKGLYLRSESAGRWLVMLESGGKLRAGERVELEAGVELELIEPAGEGQWRVGYEGAEPVERLLGRIGKAPLPPYIQKARKGQAEASVQAEDSERYNTVYAGEAGSVAAPTAGLHFTPGLLEAMEAAGVARAAVTLHVGLGTFAPIRTEELGAHRMHEEWIEVPGATVRALKAARERGGRVLVVGTTSVRALESLPKDWEGLEEAGYKGATDLFIYPGSGFEFRFTDLLMTNFHLPRSTLLAMVAALPGVGLARLKGWYGEAIEAGYRFYSYGDAMVVV